MTKIHPPKRDHNRLTLQEIGLLSYIIRHRDEAGHFSQRMILTADDCLTTRPVIHRTTHSLISKKYLTVVQESVRGEDGWLTPLVVKPSPLADLDWSSISSPQSIDNKTKPSPVGQLPDNSNIDIKKVCSTELCSTEGYEDSCPPVDLVPSPLMDLAPSGISDSPRIPICEFGDCTNSPLEGSTLCYRHATRSAGVMGGAQ